VRTQNPDVFVALAFRRALWNQADARLKAGATRTKTEFSHRLYKPDIDRINRTGRSACATKDLYQRYFASFQRLGRDN